jgi:hypothetical protein
VPTHPTQYYCVQNEMIHEPEPPVPMSSSTSSNAPSLFPYTNIVVPRASIEWIERLSQSTHRHTLVCM